MSPQPSLTQDLWQKYTTTSSILESSNNQVLVWLPTRILPMFPGSHSSFSCGQSKAEVRNPLSLPRLYIFPFLKHFVWLQVLNWTATTFSKTFFVLSKFEIFRKQMYLMYTKIAVLCSSSLRTSGFLCVIYILVLREIPLVSPSYCFSNYLVLASELQYAQYCCEHIGQE